MNRLRWAGFLCLLASATATAAVDPVLLRLVMPDAKILSGLQVDQAQASPFGQYVFSRMQVSDTGFQQLMAATGFDPRRNLHEILAAGAPDATGNTNGGLVLGRGSFDARQIASAAVAAGASVVLSLIHI